MALLAMRPFDESSFSEGSGSGGPGPADGAERGGAPQRAGGSPAAAPAHVSVLAREVVDLLAIRPDGVYVDATFGAGGHARLILETLGPSGRLVAFDADPSARERALDDPRFTLVHATFRALYDRLDVLGVAEMDGVLFDLGVSSMQLDVGERGFSCRAGAALDRRMDPTRGESAA